MPFRCHASTPCWTHSTNSRYAVLPKVQDRSQCSQDRQLEVRTYIVQHDADKHVEGYSEEVDNGGTALFWHILAAHLHHAGPEDADACLKHTEGYQLDLAFEGDSCQQVSSASGKHNLVTEMGRGSHC